MNRAWKQRNGAKVRLAARRAKLIRDALRQSIDVDKLIDDFLDMRFTEITPQQARSWAQTHGRTNNKPMEQALRQIYAESYALGQDIGISAIAKAKINKAPTLQQLRNAMGINWNTWKAGNKPAALLLQQPRGLSTLLDNRGITVQGINRTTLDRIGTILAQALREGATPSSVRGEVQTLIAPSRADLARKLGVDINDLLSDSERALNIAQTEMSRAVSIANRELYEDSGVELVEWLVAEPCDLCQENADVSPIRIDDTFPSGDTEPPAHPNCVCDIAPYVVDTRNIGSDALSSILGDD